MSAAIWVALLFSFGCIGCFVLGYRLGFIAGLDQADQMLDSIVTQKYQELKKQQSKEDSHANP